MGPSVVEEGFFEHYVGLTLSWTNLIIALAELKTFRSDTCVFFLATRLRKYDSPELGISQESHGVMARRACLPEISHGSDNLSAISQKGLQSSYIDRQL